MVRLFISQVRKSKPPKQSDPPQSFSKLTVWDYNFTFSQIFSTSDLLTSSGGLLQIACVLSPPKFICWNPNPKVMILGGEPVWGHEVMRVEPQGSLIPSAACGDTVRRHIYKPGSGLSPDALVLDFPASRAVINKCVLCMNLPVYGIFVAIKYWTKTGFKDNHLSWGAVAIRLEIKSMLTEIHTEAVLTA